MAATQLQAFAISFSGLGDLLSCRPTSYNLCFVDHCNRSSAMSPARNKVMVSSNKIIK